MELIVNLSGRVAKTLERLVGGRLDCGAEARDVFEPRMETGSEHFAY